MAKVTVIGSGAWGTALAQIFKADNMVSGRAQSANIESDFVFIAVEAQKFREVIARHKFAKNNILIICAKGIEQQRLKLMGEIVQEILPNQYAVLSGPNFADEVTKGLPSATTIACKDKTIGEKIIGQLGQVNFRFYFTDDVISTQIGGAVKNVLAIAAGIAIGKGLGENARAAIITRGIAEISRLAVAKGGRAETLMGLAGFGDIVLTCTSEKSRNTKFGMNLAKINEPQKLIKENQGVIEGYYTAKSVYELAKKLKVEMPICFLIYEILYNGKDIDEAINDLLKRPQGEQKRNPH